MKWLALLIVACAPELAPAGHIVVWLDTDAPLPGLLDAARVEVFNADRELVDAREIGLDDARVRSGLSFVVAPATPGSSVLVHVTMWRASTGRAAPIASESLDGWFSLPASPAEGSRDVTISLGLDTLGLPQGSREKPIAAALGHSPSRVGSWPAAARTPCAGAANDGEVCVPGGAFFMGHPRLANLGLSSAGHTRLVVLSPFFLDVNEVTVAAYRRDGKVYAGRWTGSYTSGDAKDLCTFTDLPGEHDGLPVNCVRFEPAREYCRSIGKDLPTEAQLEYVSTSFGTALHPWGDELPRCGDAVFGRGGSPAYPGFPPSCRGPGTTPRDRLGSVEPVVRESYGRDFLRLPRGELHDLIGNLGKWVLDRGATEDDPCWRPRAPNVLVDPVCAEASLAFAPGTRAFRGTGFFMPPVSGPSKGVENDGAFPEIGFRCARPSQ
jgi:formylglycine-generating enzyme